MEIFDLPRIFSTAPSEKIATQESSSCLERIAEILKSVVAWIVSLVTCEKIHLFEETTKEPSSPPKSTDRIIEEDPEVKLALDQVGADPIKHKYLRISYNFIVLVLRKMCLTGEEIKVSGTQVEKDGDRKCHLEISLPSSLQNKKLDTLLNPNDQALEKLMTTIEADGMLISEADVNSDYREYSDQFSVSAEHQELKEAGVVLSSAKTTLVHKGLHYTQFIFLGIGQLFSNNYPYWSRDEKSQTIHYKLGIDEHASEESLKFIDRLLSAAGEVCEEAFPQDASSDPFVFFYNPNERSFDLSIRRLERLGYCLLPLEQVKKLTELESLQSDDTQESSSCLSRIAQLFKDVLAWIVKIATCGFVSLFEEKSEKGKPEETPKPKPPQKSPTK